MMLRAAALVSLVLAGLTTAVATGWGSLVLFYLAPGSETVRTVLAWDFAALDLATIGALAVRRARRPASASRSPSS